MEKWRLHKGFLFLPVHASCCKGCFYEEFENRFLPIMSESKQWLPIDPHLILMWP